MFKFLQMLSNIINYIPLILHLGLAITTLYVAYVVVMRLNFLFNKGWRRMMPEGAETRIKDAKTLKQIIKRILIALTIFSIIFIAMPNSAIIYNTQYHYDRVSQSEKGINFWVKAYMQSIKYSMHRLSTVVISYSLLCLMMLASIGTVEQIKKMLHFDGYIYEGYKKLVIEFHNNARNTTKAVLVAFIIAIAVFYTTPDFSEAQSTCYNYFVENIINYQASPKLIF